MPLSSLALVGGAFHHATTVFAGLIWNVTVSSQKFSGPSIHLIMSLSANKIQTFLSPLIIPC